MTYCKETYAQLAEGEMVDPHRLLGIHEDGHLIRLWRPGLDAVSITLKGEVVELEKVAEGLFERRFEEEVLSLDYEVTHPKGLTSYDPYAFFPTFSREDEILFSQGEHERLYEVIGGRLTSHQGAEGVKFAVWAPCARSVALVGDFNEWNPKLNPMRRMGASGVWELFIPGLTEGEKYKFALVNSEGHLRYKADPFAFQGEPRPQTASVVCTVHKHKWQDEEWIATRQKEDFLKKPLNIYELHIGSWKKHGSDFLNYREVAHKLAEHCIQMGYTHVELMPVMGHPLDESWGYQVTGFYAISQRYGSIEDFQFFVDYMHGKGIGVILDWVPGHFPTDDHSLAQFDGTYLYEHLDPRQGYHPHWNTHIFNFGRYEVMNFLIGSALFYLEVMHVDGLRVDAVSSIVYLDFGREKGEWLPNIHGGNENLEGIAFLTKLNKQIHEKFPGTLMIAEESHAYPGVTSQEGLGFDLKWAMGWMNDTLRFFETAHPYRTHRHEMLLHTFSYAFTEKFVLALSHDEVVHQKKSLLSKMPGNEWEKFANLRLLLSYMICYPGKKLLFMGGEFGQWHEWSSSEEIHWDVLQAPYNRKLQGCIRDLNHFYQEHPALWEEDFSEKGFEWITHPPGLFVYWRKGKKEKLLCIHNFTPDLLEEICIPIGKVKRMQMAFNTDSQEYGGYGIITDTISLENEGITLNIPPLATLILSCS